MNTQLNEMVLRTGRPADEAAIRRLALLDSARPLRGEALVAEVSGRPVAAIDLSDGRVVADPFEHTADVVELLRVRAGEMTPRPQRTPRTGMLARLRAAA